MSKEKLFGDVLQVDNDLLNVDDGLGGAEQKLSCFSLILASLLQNGQ